MCTGTMYWAHIGRLVYAASEEELARLTGKGNPENFTMTGGCRSVMSLVGGQKDIEIVGPLETTWERTVVQASDISYWREVRDGLGIQDAE